MPQQLQQWDFILVLFPYLTQCQSSVFLVTWMHIEPRNEICCSPTPAYCTPWNKIGGYARARESECYIVHSLMVEMIEHSQAKIKVPMLLFSHERIHIGDKILFPEQI